MRALFVADAHLIHPDDANYMHLLHFLEKQLGRLNVLVLLGDIFEFWIGVRKEAPAAQQPFLRLLERFQSQGTEIVYVEGNHDFHLSRFFRDWPHVTILPDGGTLTLDGETLYLAHGDLANPEDRGYRLLRRVLRSTPLRWLAGALPGDLSEWIASHASRQSKQSHHDKSRRWPAHDILLNYARDLNRRGHKTIITGHFHQPFHEQQTEFELIALGDWITQYSYAVYDEGVMELKTFPCPSAASS